MTDKRLKGNKSTTFAIILFIILCLFIAVLIAMLINNTKPDDGNEPTTEPVSTEAASTATPAGETETPAVSDTEKPVDATPAPSSAPTDVPTPGPTSTPAATPKPTEKPADAPAFESLSKDGFAVIKNPSEIDFSFLDGIPTEHFEDADENSFDWYPGLVVYNESTKTPDYKWDRYNSTLGWLKKYNGIYIQNTSEKVIYLTFDCGYENGVTTQILDVLKEKNCSGIFFVTGDYVDDKANKPIMQRMIDEGNLIGSHTDNHPVMPTLSNEKFVEELNGVYTKLKSVLGDDFKLTYYRPPQGASSPRDLALSYYLGYKSTFWAFAYGDYNPDNQPEKAAALSKMKSYLHPGAVYLLHAVSSTNAAVLGDFIDWVRAEGYEIRRIDA